MDRDFIAKTRRKKARRIALLCVLIAVCVVLALSLRKRGEGGGRTAEVTIEIRCDALSEHPERLADDSLADVIPADGTILSETAWEIVPGETSVFDVTDAVCREYDIQIEYSYSPGYNSHYIEGIGYIYEFSAGKYSGWLFTVDGEAPNYGADKIVLSGGEKIEWVFEMDYRSD